MSKILANGHEKENMKTPRRHLRPYTRKPRPNPAYESFDNKWKATRFAMGVARKMAEHWDCPLIESYRRLNEINEIEEDLLRFYDILHTQGYGYIIPDIEQKWEENGSEKEQTRKEITSMDPRIMSANYNVTVMFRKLEGQAIALISEHMGTTLTEAMGCYIEHSDLSETIWEHCNAADGIEDESRDRRFLDEMVSAL